MTENNKSTLKSLERSLDIIDVLAKNPVPMSAQELSDALKVNRTTIYSSLNTLSNKNYIEKNSSTGKYSIGYRLFEIGLHYKYKFPFTSVVEHYAKEINNKYHISINLGVFKKPNSVLMLLSQNQVNSRISSSPMLPVNYTLPVYASAIGKVILSGMQEEQIQQILDSITFKPFTSNTITSKEIILEELNEIKKNGYAVDRSEYFNNFYCIAAPIRDYTGTIIAGISVSDMEKSYFEEHFDKLSKEICIVSNQISLSLGYAQ
ncbi:IclR family transcriptional regulator [Sedimentibacter sp. B4]|uniref:IclR family transcriptional regulator n=1 Tax=Sedimentibacter sp. B4 TaxID=304766 RepID=UPI0002D48602|nr:IclR family transcriptional regulator C-terminal domain-containing protein [Sedimentibacter sp. B4]